MVSSVCFEGKLFPYFNLLTCVCFRAAWNATGPAWVAAMYLRAALVQEM